MMGIYTIEGPGGAIYVGKSINVERRWVQHEADLRRNRHGSRYLQYAWNKHGSEAFTFSLLENVQDERVLLDREQYWLDVLFLTMPHDAIYNHCTFAHGGGHTKGRKNNENQIKALIEANKRRIWTPEVRAEYARVRTGLKQSEETIAKRVAKSRGQKRTLEQLTNRVNSRMKGRNKIYTFVSPDGVVYSNIIVVGMFGREHNLDRSALHKLLKGKIQHHKGWTGYEQT